MPAGSLETKRLPAGAVLVVGAGLAGLYLALKLAPRQVFVLTSRRSSKGAASAWAQGGIAAALSPNDSPAAHAQDTIAAGDGLVDSDIAMILASEGPDRVHDIAAMITGLIGWRAESLLQDSNGGVAGALARRDDGAMLGIEADVTVMATGGVGGLFAVTTNPRTARGDALGMAAVVGAKMRDMEFVQFHPTAIDIGRDPAPLATEALRGEGAVLVNPKGKRFMQRYHADKELAPRDDVARAIFAEIQAGRQPFLDCRDAIGSHFDTEFPTVFESCMSAGIDPRIAPIPVAPAVHYHMGGIATDSFGQSNLDGLLAIGECSAVGVHGANRLASNSLLEAIVFGGRAAEYIAGRDWSEKKAGTIRSQPWLAMPADITQALRDGMTANCGVRRNAESLNQLIELIDGMIDRVGRANPLIASKMIVSAALAREESRGGHFREDFTKTRRKAVSSYLTYDRLT